jgi:hypothetical protein
MIIPAALFLTTAVMWIAGKPASGTLIALDFRPLFTVLLSVPGLLILLLLAIAHRGGPILEIGTGVIGLLLGSAVFLVMGSWNMQQGFGAMPPVINVWGFGISVGFLSDGVYALEKSRVIDLRKLFLKMMYD